MPVSWLTGIDKYFTVNTSVNHERLKTVIPN